MIKVQGDRGGEGQEPGGGEKDLPGGRSLLLEDDIKDISGLFAFQHLIPFGTEICNLFTNRNTCASFPTLISFFPFRTKKRHS